MTPPALRAAHLSKRFGGTLALDDVGIEIGAGEVHGLLGHNGSGKSTLIKILAGYHAPEPGGVLEVGGRPVRLPLAPGAFRSLGMAFVHQDPGLVGALTVVENLSIGALAGGGLAPVSWRARTAQVAALLREFGLGCAPLARVETLEPWHRPLLGIIRAVDEMRSLMRASDRRAGVLVLDEPTASLGGARVDQLFSVVRTVTAQGIGVLFVSHDLDEVMAITDRITVLRDGRVAGKDRTDALTKNELVEMIIGRRLAARAPSSAGVARSDAGVSVTGLRGEGVRDAGLSIGRGEIVGATGLAGSGFTELGKLLIGFARARAGTLRLGGATIDLTRVTPDAAIAAGIAYVPGERLREGCFADLTLTENISVPVMGRFFRGGVLRRAALTDHARALCEQFEVRPPDPCLSLQALSGGNQQKVLLAKWLQLKPALLILQEPTQGVDIGAREQIFAIIRASAQAGAAILCLSGDHEQLASLCSRVLVFRQGRIAAELSAADLTKDRIAYECFGTDIAAGAHAQ